LEQLLSALCFLLQTNNNAKKWAVPLLFCQITAFYLVAFFLSHFLPPGSIYGLPIYNHAHTFAPLHRLTFS